MFVLFSCAATLHFIMFFFVPSNPELTSHKSTHRLSNQTKLKSILMDLIWLNPLRNSCTFPYLFWLFWAQIRLGVLIP